VGRGFVGNELISWGNRTITSSPAGSLLSVSRGLKGTTADSHVTASSVYNSWLDERIEDMSGLVDDSLPNYDQFPDVRSPAETVPSVIEVITRDLTLTEAHRKLGIIRSDEEIRNRFLIPANERLDGLRADSLVIEPRLFVDTLVFGKEDLLYQQEAPLTKRNLDPWTASLTNYAIKVVPLTPDEMVNPQLPRRFKSEEFTTAISGLIYWSELAQRWVLRKLKELPDNTNISYLYTENRMNWATKRKAQQRQFLDIARG